MKLVPVDGDPFAENQSVKLKPVEGDPFAIPNQAAMHPEARIGPFTINGETDAGFNPAAALIKAGDVFNKIRAGGIQAQYGPAEWLRKKIDPNAAPNPLLQAVDAEQQQNAPAMKDLQAVHPGSTLIGDLAAAAGVPWRALPAVVASEYGSPGERALKGGAAFLGGKLIQKGGQIASRLFQKSETNAADAAVQNAVKDQTTQAGQAAGFVAPPAQANPTIINRLAEGYSGKIATGQSASITNQPVVDKLIKADLGLPADKPVTLGAIQGVRNKAYQDGYEPIKRETGLLPDQQFASEVSAVGGQDYAALVKDVPEMANAQIDKIATALNKPEFSGRTAVSLIRKFRSDATANFKNAQDPNALEAAHAQQAAADALEGLVERNLTARGMPDAVANFQAARQTIAMAHDAERAFNQSSGSFAASEYASLLDKKRPLSGGAKLVGQFAGLYPKATQEITSSMPGISPLDYAAFGGISAALGNPSMLAGVLGRPALRAGILSQPYQRFMTRPQYKPSGLLKGTSRALDNDMAPWIGSLLGYQAANP